LKNVDKKASQAKTSPPPFDNLRFLYVGSKDVERDSIFYKESLGAEILWKITDFGTTVAAVRISNSPVLLLADHQTVLSCELIFEVKDLKKTETEMKNRVGSRKEESSSSKRSLLCIQGSEWKRICGLSRSEATGRAVFR